MTKKESTSDLAVKVEKGVSSLSEHLPKQVQPFVIKAAPVIGKIAETVEKIIPVLEECYARLLVFWAKLQPYKPHLLIPAIVGLIMCFFGGSFLAIIAAVEAFRMCGYENTMASFKNLSDDFNKIADVNKKDNKVDDNKDGVADVQQIATKELVHRKALLFLKTVDPKRLSDAFTGIYMGLMAIIATLKLGFVKAITLGSAMGATLEKPTFKYFLPRVEAALPEEYKKWAKPVISFILKAIAISIAWTVQRMVSVFHSSIRGGLLFSRNMLVYLNEMGHTKINQEDTYIDEIVGGGIALLGLLWQLRSGFQLPTALTLLLFPFLVAEYTLEWLVSEYRS